MKVIKKINNNVALCLDSAGNELVAFGKGIGFPNMPYELSDLSLIEDTYYNVSPEQQSLLSGIDENIFALSARITDLAKSQLSSQLNPNLVFTLADHISFSIERYRKGLHIKMPNAADVAMQYPMEMELGKQAMQMINSTMKIGLGKEESVSLALHFLNAEVTTEEPSGVLRLNRETISENILAMIEEDFECSIDRDGFNCSRFLSHLAYLYGRIEQGTELNSENSRMYQSVAEDYPRAHACALRIRDYFKEALTYSLQDEDVLYLMMHINRLTTRVA